MVIPPVPIVLYNIAAEILFWSAILLAYYGDTPRAAYALGMAGYCKACYVLELIKKKEKGVKP